MLKSLQLNIFHYILCKLPLPAPPLWGKNPCQEPNLPKPKLNCNKAGYGILSNISPGLFQNKEEKEGGIDTFSFHRESESKGSSDAPLQLSFSRSLSALRWLSKHIIQSQHEFPHPHWLTHSPPTHTQTYALHPKICPPRSRSLWPPPKSIATYCYRVPSNVTDE